MAGISFSGLSSGLDSDAIVRSLVEVQRIPILRLQEQNRFNDSKIGVIDRLSSALSALRTAGNNLDTPGEFLSFKGTSSDTDVATITPSGDAVAGRYTLEVTSLAQAQRSYSTTIADKEAALSATDQTLQLTIDGQATVIDVDAGSTLEDLVGLINGSGANVTAGLLFDGSQYRLQIAGNEVGASQAITFSDSGLGLNLTTPPNTTATDAVFELDGFPITSSDNLVDDAIPGVTIDLKAQTTGPITLSVAADASAVKGKIQGFVTAYNNVLSIINEQVGEGKGQTTLNGDSTVRALEQSLSNLISSPIPGLETAAGDSMQLADLGIKTQGDGTLTLDSEKLDEKLASGFRSLATYFGGNPSQEVDGIGQLMSDLVRSYTNGTDGLLFIRKQGLNAISDGNEERIGSLENLLEGFEQGLREQFTRLETTMSSLQSQQNLLARFLQR